MAIPDFPSAAGDEYAVEFAKDGRNYRVLRIDDRSLLIHQAGSSAEAFELLITNVSADGTIFDVLGRGGSAAVTGLGADRTILSRLF